MDDKVKKGEKIIEDLIWIKKNYRDELCISDSDALSDACNFIQEVIRNAV